MWSKDVHTVLRIISRSPEKIVSRMSVCQSGREEQGLCPFLASLVGVMTPQCLNSAIDMC